MDTEYFIDSAFELGEISPIHCAVLYSPLGAYWEVRKSVDTNAITSEDFLRNTAQARLQNASLPEKYFFAMSAFNGLEFGLKTLTERIAHVVQNRVQQDLGLAQPLFAGLYPEAQRGSGALVRQESDVSEGLVRQMLDAMYGETAAQWCEDLCLMREALTWFQADNGAAYEAMHNAVTFQDVANSIVPDAVLKAAMKVRIAEQKREQAKQRTIQTRARAAIKKATKLFVGLGQEKNLSLFVSGGEVTLAHPDSKVKFVVKPLEVAGWLIDRTSVGRSHTPYELHLFTKEDVFLSKLCVYFKDTPVLDQLLALSLFVQAGDEIKILEKANWFALSDWNPEKSAVVLQAYPQLESKLPVPLNEVAVTGPRIRVNPVFEAQRTQWEPFKGRVQQWIETWLEPARVATQQLLTAAPGIERHMQVAFQKQREILYHAVPQALTA